MDSEWRDVLPCQRCGVAPSQNPVVYFCAPCEDIEQAAAALRECGVVVPLPDYSDPADVQRFCDAISALA